MVDAFLLTFVIVGVLSLNKLIRLNSRFYIYIWADCVVDINENFGKVETMLHLRAKVGDIVE